MTSVALLKIRNGILAAGVCASLAVGTLGFGGNAEARVNGPRTTESAQICGWLQDEYDANLQKRNQYKYGSANWHYYNNRLINLNSAWKEQDCDDEFGGIAFRVVPQAVVNNVENLGTLTEVSPVEPALSVKVQANVQPGMVFSPAN